LAALCLDVPAASSTGNQAHRRTFYTLQAGRGIAALMVVLFHIGGFGGNDIPLWRHTFFERLFYPGFYGVDFFFILSGFVMVSAHWHDFDHPGRTQRYFFNRFRRIYPIYWIFLIPTVIKQLLVIGHHGSGQRNLFVILSSFLLVHINSLAVNLVVSWTLFHEILFYVFFATLLLNKRIGFVFCTCWLAASFFFFTQDAYAAEPSSYLDMFFSPLHLLFAFGALAGYVLQRRAGPEKISVFLLGVGICVCFFALNLKYPVQAPWARIVGGAGLTLAVVTMAQREASMGFQVPRVLTRLGDASYSIYLSHYMVVWMLSKACFHLDGRLHLPLVLYVIFIFAVVVGVGVMVHLWVERPLLRMLGARKTAQVRCPIYEVT
jgi:peptidoglycan/LPS O-acetylase OafA/YrhL